MLMVMPEVAMLEMVKMMLLCSISLLNGQRSNGLPKLVRLAHQGAGNGAVRVSGNAIR